MSTRSSWGLMVVVSLLAGALPAMAAPITVGSGDSHAEVYIEFKDGAIYTFDVAFNGSVSGLDLLDAIEAGTTLTTIRVFGGLFIDGISYDGHGNSGFGGGEDWWHYWTRDADSPWTSPFFGAGDRVAQDGSADGWIYGRDGAPLPEPATAVLGLAGAALLAIPRSRRAARR